MFPTALNYKLKLVPNRCTALRPRREKAEDLNLSKREVNCLRDYYLLVCKHCLENYESKKPGWRILLAGARK